MWSEKMDGSATWALSGTADRSRADERRKTRVMVNVDKESECLFPSEAMETLTCFGEESESACGPSWVKPFFS